MPRRFSPVAFGLATVLLSGCVGALPELDFDFRGNAISGARVETAPRPEPDASGLISYESYQVVVARRGDTVAEVAERVGLTSAELASFNGRATSDVLRDGEVLALPRRVTAGDGGGTDIASIARGAIDEAEPGRTAAAPEVQPGTEPVRHRVGRGETAYSIARLYGVSGAGAGGMERAGTGPRGAREPVPAHSDRAGGERLGGHAGAGHEHRPAPAVGRRAPARSDRDRPPAARIRRRTDAARTGAGTGAATRGRGRG